MGVEHNLEIINSLPVMIRLVDEAGQDTHFNPTWLKFTGHTLQEALASDRFDLIHTDDLEYYKECYTAAFEAREEGTLVYRMRQADGAYRWIQDHCAPRFLADGDFGGFISVCTDITEHRQPSTEWARYREHLERLLDARTAQLRQERIDHETTVDALAYERDFTENLIHTAPVIILLLDKQGRIARFNHYMETLSGYRFQEVQGQDWCSILLPEHQREPVRTALQQGIEDFDVRTGSSTLVTKGQDNREIAWYARALTDGTGTTLGLLVVGLDITERKQIEAERRQLSRELHDEAGQALVGIRLGLEAVRADISAESESLRQRLDDVTNLTDTAMENLRLLARTLRPPALDVVGLAPAMADYCDSLARSANLAVDFTHDDITKLSDDASAGLYRILQETLTNVVKHADAKHVTVRLSGQKDSVCLTVEDDGRGIASPDRNHRPDSLHHIGLVGIRERLALLGGRLEISARPGGGTRLAAYIPEQGNL